LIQSRGSTGEGEIEILTDPEKMAAIEKKMGREVGVVSRDKYWLWINDAVRFPAALKESMEGLCRCCQDLPVLP